MSSPRDNGRDGDRALSSLYRQAPRPKPRAAVDEAILAASRRTSTSRRRSARSAAGRRRVTVSVAAMMLVAVVLAPALYEQVRPPSVESPSRDAAPPVEERAAPGAEREEAASASGSASPASRFEAVPDAVPQSAPVHQRAVEAERMQAAPAAARSMPEPAQMLARIETLLAAGDAAAARALLERMRERFPDYPVDEALLRRLDLP